ncbi:MAG: hypothetical protein DI548_13700, partial [Flavobacterium johnsoniae]
MIFMVINNKKRTTIVLILKKKKKKLFKEFDDVKIENILKKDSYIIHKGSGITLENGAEYVFYPYTDVRLNQGKIFNRIAKKGDKIIKERHGDTLYLIQKNKIFKYIFNKFEEFNCMDSNFLDEEEVTHVMFFMAYYLTKNKKIK